MIGEGFWTTGVTVRYGYAGDGWHGWFADLKFQDSGRFSHDDPAKGRISTEGELATRYALRAVSERGPALDSEALAEAHRRALTAAVDVLRADAERMGIRFGATSDLDVWLYYHQDGEDPKSPPPAGWVALLREQADRLGWQTYREGTGR